MVDSRTENQMLTADDIDMTIRKPTMELRFVLKRLGAMEQKSRVLQQAWRVERYVRGQPTILETEWRDIPLVETP